MVELIQSNGYEILNFLKIVSAIIYLLIAKVTVVLCWTYSVFGSAKTNRKTRAAISIFVAFIVILVLADLWNFTF